MNSSKIERVTNPQDGPLDGISLNCDAVHTKFRGEGSRRRIVKQSHTDANIKASVEAGVVSISDRQRDIMLTVNLQDMTAVLMEAFNAAKEVEERCREGISEPAKDVGGR